MSDPFKPLNGANEKPASRVQSDWRAIIPVPGDARKPSVSLFRGKTIAGQWEYRNEKGQLLGFVYRLEGAGGSKEFRPCTYCRNEQGEAQWRLKTWPAPRPLYGLDRLAARPDVPVIVCEGEKAADAAGRLFPECVAVTSSNGSRSAGKADWKPLAGRRVYIWPDADAPGRKYALDVARILLQQDGTDAVVSIIEPPADQPKGWDAADCEALGDEGCKLARSLFLKAVSAAHALQKAHGSTDAPPSSSGGRAKGQGGPKRPKRPRGRDELIALADECALWHDPEKTAFATVEVNGHKENMKIASPAFERWLAGRHYRQSGGAVGETALREALRVLAARAINDGPCHQTCLRIGRHDGRIFIDLGRKEWNAVAVGPDGWEVIEQAPVKFIRSPSMKALPIPEAGELLESRLRPFVNVREEGDFLLIVGWLVAALFDSGPYPILIVNGEQGSAKSTLARLLRMLVDPNKAVNRAAPRDERDLLVSANASWVLSLDNLSHVPGWLSDALCRLNSNGGFATRALHTDLEEVVLQLARPIILNGIPDLASRPDLGERAITIELPAIPDHQRRKETDFWQAFEVACPFILGGLYDALAAGLRNLPHVRLERLPRMADFAIRITAVEKGLGWEPGSFMAAYEANRRMSVESAIEHDPLANAIREAITRENFPAGWTGTATRLLELLGERAPEIMNSRFAPRSASAVGAAFKRVQPVLRKIGYEIERRRSARRLIHITPPKAPEA